jgi:hypothetical protein
MFNRRKLFAFLPIAPAALMIDGAKAIGLQEQPRDGEQTISLRATKINTTKSTSIFGNMPISDPNKLVSMAVGQDGNLWLKTIDGEWKRVVTE